MREVRVRADMVRAYVESLLEDLTGVEKVKADADGDYPVRFRDALYYVRVVGETHPVVQVFSVAVADVACTDALLRDLNEQNARIRFARVLWVRDQVLVEADLVGSSVDPESFGAACQAVATISDVIARELAERHGGRPAFVEERTAPPQSGPTGMYL